MNPQDIKWTVTRVDGKISAVSPDWRGLQRTAKWLSAAAGDFSPKTGIKTPLQEVSTQILTMAELQGLSRSLTLDDLLLLGTDFQKEIWTELFKLTHPVQQAPGIFSYSEFAARCGKSNGLRAVAHAIALNPVNYIIPCHLIVPLDTLRRIEAAYEAAMDTIFEGRDLYVFGAFDMGDYSLGKDIKSGLIALDMQQ